MRDKRQAMYQHISKVMRSELLVVLILFGLAAGIAVSAQDPATGAFVRAKHLFDRGDWPAAERSFESIVRDYPNNLEAQVYLGETLFREEKYTAAVAPFEKARSLEKSGVKLTSAQHRILVDQLAMAYGISGRTADAKAILQQAVVSDPDYPLNYYNLACVAADENDKPTVLKNLVLAFQHRNQLLPGEQMPDAASDPSFQKYAKDVDFNALLSRFRQ